MEPTPSNSANPTPETPDTTTPAEATEVVESNSTVQNTEAPAPVETTPVAESVSESVATEPASENNATTEPTPQQVPVVDPAASQVTSTPVNPGHGLGIASLILSILGVSLIGLILGIIGLNKSKKAGQKNGLALAGIIIGAIGLVLGLIFAIFLISVASQLAATCADLGPGMHTVNGAAFTCN